MSFFDIKNNSTKGIPGTTKGFFLGKPEADSEDKSHEAIAFSDFFEDFAEITDKISRGRFIILGRKGTGKSAYVKWVMDQQATNDSLIAAKIKGEDLKFHQLLKNSISKEENYFTLLFEWIIQINIINLLIRTQRAQGSRGIPALKQFMKDNSGITQLDSLLTVSISETRGPSLDLKALSGIFNINLGKKTERQFKKPDFWQFIPQLRQIIKEVLSYQDLQDLNFVLMFDELDYKLNLKDESSRVQLMDLIRVVRNYNVDYLKSSNLNVILFMRDDVARALDGIAHDKAKIFSSHAYTINWYDPIDEKTDECQVKLRKFINRRLKANFKYLKQSYNDDDPWQTFVDEKDIDAYGKRSAFKNILDHTFYRPRDLINIFLNIGDYSLPVPLSSENVRSLLREYAKRNFSEITDELAIIYDKQQMAAFKSALTSLSSYSGPIPYSKVIDALQVSHLGASELETLVSYSVIAPYDAKNNIFYFNFRETHPTVDLSKYSYLIPYGIRLYFNPRAKTSMEFKNIEDLD